MRLDLSLATQNLGGYSEECLQVVRTVSLFHCSLHCANTMYRLSLNLILDLSFLFYFAKYLSIQIAHSSNHHCLDELLSSHPSGSELFTAKP